MSTPHYNIHLMDMRDTYPRSFILKCLARGGYGKFGSDAAPGVVSTFLAHARQAAATGRVIDLGVMNYAQSHKAAEIGTSILSTGKVGHPFQNGYWVIGENSFSKTQEGLASTIVFVLPDEDAKRFLFAECALTRNNDVCLWYLAQFDNGGLAVLYDSMDPLTRAAMTDQKQSHPASHYAVGMNAAFTALAVCNTRGIAHKHHKPQRSGKKVLRAGHYRFDTKAYFTALTTKAPTEPVEAGSRRSPIPHLRRGHVRTYQNGNTRWIHDMMINCTSEGELAFTEGRQAYVVRPRKMREVMEGK